MMKKTIKVIPFEHRNMMGILGSYMSKESRRAPYEKIQINSKIAQMISKHLALKLCVIPIGITKDKIVLAMANPLDAAARDSIRLKLKKNIKVVVSPRNEILKAIENIFGETSEQDLRALVEEQSNTEYKSGWDKKDENDNVTEIDSSKAPVVNYVNMILQQSVKKRASDIHIEPQDNETIVRIRIDGILEDTIAPPPNMRSAVIARMKILAEMNIAERRLPQDGHFEMKMNDNKIDIRVSTIPTKYGEKMVMRLLNPQADNFSLDKLGFEKNELNIFKDALNRPNGIIILTGPTGCGKSTTLYSALNYLNQSHRNITTIEDPIEYTIPKINQIQVNENIGLDFASLSKCTLRQDPDIILIGEIRDKPTAEIAIKASLTGNIVLTTLHANDAPSVLTHFKNMGIPSHFLASTLNLVVAQRLVRKVCDNCKSQEPLENEYLNRLNLNDTINISRDQGCEICRGTGYFGRTLLFEFFPVNSELRSKLAAGSDEFEVRQYLRSNGFVSLFECGVKKINDNITTPQEVLTATYEDEKAEIYNNLNGQELIVSER